MRLYCFQTPYICKIFAWRVWGVQQGFVAQESWLTGDLKAREDYSAAPERRVMRSWRAFMRRSFSSVG